MLSPKTKILLSSHDNKMNLVMKKLALESQDNKLINSGSTHGIKKRIQIVSLAVFLASVSFAHN